MSGGPVPREEFVETIDGVSFDEAGEDVGEVSFGVDAVEFAGLDERGQDRPMLAAAIRAREERILAIESRCPFILPMSGRNLKCITAGIPIFVAGFVSGRSRNALMVVTFG
jgi:hypothetical protein